MNRCIEIHLLKINIYLMPLIYKGIAKKKTKNLKRYTSNKNFPVTTKIHIQGTSPYMGIALVESWLYIIINLNLHPTLFENQPMTSNQGQQVKAELVINSMCNWMNGLIYMLRKYRLLEKYIWQSFCILEWIADFWVLLMS